MKDVCCARRVGGIEDGEGEDEWWVRRDWICWGVMREGG